MIYPRSLLILLLASILASSLFPPCSPQFPQITAEEYRIFNENRNLPVIQRYLDQVYFRCKIYFSDELISLQSNVLSSCGTQTGFDYKNARYPSYITQESMYWYPNGLDKCFHKCILDKLYQNTGNKYAALVFRTNRGQEILRIFNSRIGKTYQSLSILLWKTCHTFSVEALDAKNLSPPPAVYACYLAELHWYCVDYYLRDFNQSPDHLPVCIREDLDPREIDGMGPPFGSGT